MIFSVDIFAVAQDVVLGNADVFEQLPGGVGKPGGFNTALLGGEILDYIVETGVRLAAFQQGEQLFVKVFRIYHRCSHTCSVKLSKCLLNPMSRLSGINFIGWGA